MPRKYLFVDEAGHLDFSLKGSRYFILASVAVDDCSVGDALLESRRELVWQGTELTDAFHATTEKQAVRDEVYRLLGQHDFRVDATVFEKPKAMPHLQKDDTFYELAWYLHMKHVAPRVAKQGDDLMVAGASAAAARNRHRGCRQPDSTGGDCSVDLLAGGKRSVPTGGGLLLLGNSAHVEQGDPRSYALIASKIRTEFDVFRFGNVRYYEGK
ncbi:MAG: hypothetical protein QOF33_205 [Thermomicrobiales bacterium]|nr:hypothetical protein [Thermomicrobiales bacterium]